MADLESTRRKQMLRTISGFSSTEQNEIYRILVKHDIPHTVNSNGAFFNMARLPTDVFEEIEKCVRFFESNKNELDEFEKRIAELKHNKAPTTAPPPTESIVEASTTTVQDERVSRIYDALFSSVQTAVKPRQTTKYSLAKKRFSKKQSVSDARSRVTDVDPSEILRPESPILH